jgi:hypothetical protein
LVLEYLELRYCPYLLLNPEYLEGQHLRYRLLVLADLLRPEHPGDLGDPELLYCLCRLLDPEYLEALEDLLFGLRYSKKFLPKPIDLRQLLQYNYLPVRYLYWVIRLM